MIYVKNKKNPQLLKCCTFIRQWSPVLLQRSGANENGTTFSTTKSRGRSLMAVHLLHCQGGDSALWMLGHLLVDVLFCLCWWSNLGEGSRHESRGWFWAVLASGHFANHSASPLVQYLLRFKSLHSLWHNCGTHQIYWTTTVKTIAAQVLCQSTVIGGIQLSDTKEERGMACCSVAASGR